MNQGLKRRIILDFAAIVFVTILLLFASACGMVVERIWHIDHTLIVFGIVLIALIVLRPR